MQIGADVIGLHLSLAAQRLLRSDWEKQWAGQTVTSNVLTDRQEEISPLLQGPLV